MIAENTQTLDIWEERWKSLQSAIDRLYGMANGSSAQCAFNAC